MYYIVALIAIVNKGVNVPVMAFLLCGNLLSEYLKKKKEDIVVRWIDGYQAVCQIDEIGGLLFLFSV
ncbi:MAG: hypothetical protein DKM50_08860 [Candidatus Margulisiibacteriota bacterium]|nr:MAG: hypothetical protein A2X43_04440 [Candidatus Margulisbacteria bacterium GWD2_39_127]OGI04134.1 MAG: hypothetical protein A2X42_04725 [Candidatus Margulisbacteria bacterium GWF2_38_17]PZM79559.1 MAG: hypothetical protein DKM50_08860 [Candidatus Margulisiibacteriota bacterium]HAR63389.1 hypothetical protein [Candidatus Margulisiibacteriota bacterium]HCT84442.1 hypothetical protein [Candidatus Margulisiibacteriota bacterium]